jgi:hypothetical protein
MWRMRVFWRRGVVFVASLGWALACDGKMRDDDADASQPTPHDTGGAPASGGRTATGGAPSAGGGPATGGRYYEEGGPIIDATDGGDAYVFCDHLRQLWLGDVAQIPKCNSDYDCRELVHGDYCDCTRVQIAIPVNGVEPLQNILKYYESECPGVDWAPCQHDLGPLKNLRCENSRCVGDPQTCIGTADGG